MPVPQPKDLWDKLRIVSALIASILVPLVVAIVGAGYNAAIKESEIQLRYMELAVGILKTPAAEDTENIRMWAVNVLNTYSEIPLSEKTRNELLRKSLVAAANDAVKAQPPTGHRQADHPE